VHPGVSPTDETTVPAVPNDPAAALAEATAALAAERVRSAALAESLEAKSAFLSLVAHELRGPMTVLMGYLSLLEEGAFGELPDELASTLPVINTRLAEMEGLISAMLETSRLDEHRLELLLEDVDLRDVVGSAVDRSLVFTQGDQKVAVELPTSPVLVRVDKARMSVAIANLVQNALKYSVRHTDVRCVVSEDADAASVAIIDEGVGIAEDDIALLFTRFGRIRHNPAVSGIPGAGLGLYLARELTRAHHGDVAVTSAPGVGSTFTLTLPRPRAI
jgi:signal transduction histidine kinase